MKINAAILWEQGQPLSVEDAELESPHSGEVLVEVKAAGVCHSDLHPVRGDWRTRTPLVLGHEGAGIVRAVGEDVSRVKVGDHVVFCWAPPCGVCPPCVEGHPVLCDRLDKTTYRNRLPGGGTRLRARDQDLAHFNGTACFADHAVVAEEGVVPVEAHLPFACDSRLRSYHWSWRGVKYGPIERWRENNRTRCGWSWIECHTGCENRRLRNNHCDGHP